MAIPKTSLPIGTVRAVQLRAKSSSGSKDWVAVYTTDSLYKGKLFVINGKTSDVLKGRGQGRPVKEEGINLQAAVRAKENSGKGYVFIDEFDVSNGWLSEQRSSNPPQPAPPPSQPASPPKPPEKTATTTTQQPPPQPNQAAEPSILSNTDGEEGSSCWFW